MDEFRHRRVKKIYTAFAQGFIAGTAGRITSPIEGLSAFTAYRVIQRKKEFTVVEVILETGRTNQIRIHFKRLGHPLVGETKYAFRKDFALKAKRLCLHAKELSFRHPVTNSPVHLKAEVPVYMKDFLAARPD